MQQLYIPARPAALCLCGAVKTMVRRKLLFNSSVLKPLFDSTAKKLLMSEDLDITSVCAHCIDTQPTWIDVIPTIFSDVFCCSDGYGITGLSYKFDGIAAAINNNVYRIRHSSGCVYSRTISGSYGSSKYYGSDDCSGIEGDLEDYDELHIDLTITAIGVDTVIGVKDSDRAGVEIIFCGSIICNCDDINDTANNDIVSCYINQCGSYLHPCGASGQVALIASGL